MCFSQWGHVNSGTHLSLSTDSPQLGTHLRKIQERNISWNKTGIEYWVIPCHVGLLDEHKHWTLPAKNKKLQIPIVSSAEILFGTLNPEPHPTIVQLLIHVTESPLWSLHQTLGCYHSSSSNMSHPKTTKNKSCITNGSTTLAASFLHESILRFWTLEAHFTSFMGF